MNFEDERYVRIYTRDTLTWLALTWQGRAVLVLLFRKLDRAGVLDLSGLPPVEAIAAVIGAPQDVVAEVYPALIRLRVLEHNPTTDQLVAPRFIEAQEAKASDAQRARDSRERRTAAARLIDPAAAERRFIYVARAGDGSVKIGLASDVASRLSNIRTSRPDGVSLMASWPGTADEERALHSRFANLRLAGEWFRDDGSILAFVTGRDEQAGGVVTGRDEHSPSCDGLSPQPTQPPQPLQEGVAGSAKPGRLDLGGAGGRVPCPPDLDLSPEQRATLAQSPGVPSWAVDAIRDEMRAKYADGSEPRTLERWRRSLVTMVCSRWSDSTKRPVDPNAAQQVRPGQRTIQHDPKARAELLERIARGDTKTL